jgi:glycine cleavage system H protein
LNIPEELKYTSEHEWVAIEGNIVTVGITEYAQGELGDIVFVELPVVGADVTGSESFGTIEAVKAVSDLFSPVTGKISEINPVLEDDPMVVNRDPYGDGWMVKIEISDSSELDSLLPASDYRTLVE